MSEVWVGVLCCVVLCWMKGDVAVNMYIVYVSLVHLRGGISSVYLRFIHNIIQSNYYHYKYVVCSMYMYPSYLCILSFPPRCIGTLPSLHKRLLQVSQVSQVHPPQIRRLRN